MLPGMLTLDAAHAAETTPLEVVAEVIAGRNALVDRALFMTETPDDALREMARKVMALDRTLPLWGPPSAVKDNIDVAGLPTTAAYPAFAFEATLDVPVVARLPAAEAIVIGKTTL